MLFAFSPIFVVNTKMICSYNFVVTLTSIQNIDNSVTKQTNKNRRYDMSTTDGKYY